MVLESTELFVSNSKAPSMDLEIKREFLGSLNVLRVLFSVPRYFYSVE